MKTPVSIALFLLLSGLFLTTLLGTLERSRKLLAGAGVCLACVVCVIVFLTPVKLPSVHGGSNPQSVSTTVPVTTSPAIDAQVTTEVSRTLATVSTTSSTIRPTSSLTTSTTSVFNGGQHLALPVTTEGSSVQRN